MVKELSLQKITYMKELKRNNDVNRRGASNRRGKPHHREQPIESENNTQQQGNNMGNLSKARRPIQSERSSDADRQGFKEGIWKQLNALNVVQQDL